MTELERENNNVTNDANEKRSQLQGESAMRMDQPSSTEQGHADREVVLEEMVILPMEPQQSTRPEDENGEKEVTDNAGEKSAQLAKRNGGMRRKRKLRRREDTDRRIVFEEMDVFKMFEQQETQQRTQSENSSQNERSPETSESILKPGANPVVHDVQFVDDETAVQDLEEHDRIEDGVSAERKQLEEELGWSPKRVAQEKNVCGSQTEWRIMDLFTGEWKVCSTRKAPKSEPDFQGN